MNPMQNDAAGIKIPVLGAHRTASRRSHIDNVQTIWRQHGWIPPTEAGKDFRASLKTTADRVACLT